MIEAPPAPRAALTPALVRRHAFGPAPMPSAEPVAIEEPPVAGWADDLRFFAVCYAAGILFFLILLS